MGSNGLLDLLGPKHLRPVEYALTGMLRDPFDTGIDEVLFDGAEQCSPYRLLHLILDISHPILHVLVVGVHDAHKVDLLVLSREHSMDFLGTVEFDRVDILEDFPQMWLYGSGLFRLREDLQQLIVTEEVESSESFSLAFQVVVQFLLDHIEVLIALLQFFQQTI